MAATCGGVRQSSAPAPSAVEVFRVLLRGHQTLTSARRTAVPVREARRAAVVGVDERLGLHGHLMDGAIGEVHELLGVVDREERVPALVSGIRRGGHVAFLQRGGHRRVADRPRPSAIADRLELAVPVLGGHPDFDVDDRIRGRPQRRRDAAVRGQDLGRRRRRPAAACSPPSCPGRLRRRSDGASGSPAPTRGGKRAGRHQLHGREHRIRQRKRFQVLAWRRTSQLGGQHHGHEACHGREYSSINEWGGETEVKSQKSKVKSQSRKSKARSLTRPAAASATRTRSRRAWPPGRR
jgi:hypothetical protein